MPKFIVREDYAFFVLHPKDSTRIMSRHTAGAVVELENINQYDQAWKLQPVDDDDCGCGPAPKAGEEPQADLSSMQEVEEAGDKEEVDPIKDRVRNDDKKKDAKREEIRLRLSRKKDR